MLNNLVSISYNNINNSIVIKYTNPKYICVIGNNIKTHTTEYDLAILLEEGDYTNTKNWVGNFSKTEYNIDTGILEYKYINNKYEVITSYSLYYDCSDSELLCQELLNRDNHRISFFRNIINKKSK